jgi:hypothetical protein
LLAIDYEKIIAAGKNWTDASFPPNKMSLLDSSMMRSKRHLQWESYVWKRPEEVYGDEGFVVYN